MAWTLPPSARGVWIKMPAVEVVEVFAAAGVDFVVIDREHGAVDLRTMTTMIAIARGLGLPVFVRVPAHAPAEVQQALDAGATGLFVPHVDDKAVAQGVIDACRFPPLGHRRGSPVNRAGDWGAAGLDEVVRRGNDEVVLVAQVETPRAVGNIDDILAVTGLDGVFIGPFDLALSSGLSSGSAEFLDLVDRVEQAVFAAQVERAVQDRLVLGGVAAGATGASDLLANGYSFVMVGADTSLLADSARSLLERGAA